MNTPLSPRLPPATHPAAPTVGALVGSVLGGVFAARTGLANNPDLAVPAVAVVSALFTGLFHWLGTKIIGPAQ
jgi:cobalamin synthase